MLVDVLVEVLVLVFVAVFVLLLVSELDAELLTDAVDLVVELDVVVVPLLLHPVRTKAVETAHAERSAPAGNDVDMKVSLG